MPSRVLSKRKTTGRFAVFRNDRGRRAVVLSLAVALALPERSARACATAPRPNEEVYAQHERALVVWDQTQHLEHFVRTADFVASGGAFGFLVPTPGRPELAEADDSVFDELETLTAPNTVHEKKLALFPIGCTMLPFSFLARGDKSLRDGPQPIAAGAVQVVGQARVAGLDAVTLESTDAAALADWLNAHGFAFRDALKRWVAPYLAKHFSITAFRYAPGAAEIVEGNTAAAGVASVASARVGSRAVRLTFRADAPFYPYREPDDVPSVDRRNLRLFVIDTVRVVASFDDSAKPWPAELPFSAHAPRTDALRDALPGVDLPASFWLSDYSDDARKRPPTDLVFAHSRESTEVRRPPNIVADEIPLPIPYEVPIVACGWLWWRRRTRVRRPIA